MELELDDLVSDGSWELLETQPKVKCLPRAKLNLAPRFPAPLQLGTGDLDTFSLASLQAQFSVQDLQYSNPLPRPVHEFSPQESRFTPLASAPFAPLPLRAGFLPASAATLALPQASASGERPRDHFPKDAKRSALPHPREYHERRVKHKSDSGPSKQQKLNSQQCSSNTLVRTTWTHFLEIYQPLSPFLQSLAQSEMFEDHCMRILDGFSASTVYRYLAMLIQLATVCAMHLEMHTLTDLQLADLLAAGPSCDPKFGANMRMKAMRWAHKSFQISCFSTCMGPLITSFNKVKLITDRREALPLQLLTLLQWERRLLQSSCSLKESVLLGFFLILVWSGMRFSDMQRLKLETLTLDEKSLRGISFCTKTSHRGCPFGVVISGFLSHGTFTWVHRFLRALDSIHQHSNLSEIDYLIPSMDAYESGVVTPISYGEALHYMRHTFCNFLGVGRAELLRAQ
eukprot:s5139_g2.t1